MSISVTINPLDGRCKYWAKIIRDGVAMPMPSDVSGANDVPGAYLKLGEEELFTGDILIEGEANHHRAARGWTYHITVCKIDGKQLGPVKPTAAHKAKIKEAVIAGAIDERILAGSGDIAACIRIGHALRNGIEVE